MTTIIHTDTISSNGTSTVVYTPAPAGERITFVGWLTEEMHDRDCADAPEFARKFGFAQSTVRAWLSGRRRPSVKKCEELAGMLDLLPLEVKAAAGHVTWQEIDDYANAYIRDADNWATIGDL